MATSHLSHKSFVKGTDQQFLIANVNSTNVQKRILRDAQDTFLRHFSRAPCI
jgi:hypothetical protein